MMNKTLYNWNKQKELALINHIQEEYVLELATELKKEYFNEKAMKFINFTSPTGTGKTKMIAKLLNLFPDSFFIITTLSKGQLDAQIEAALNKDVNQSNYQIYGANKLTATTKLTDADILSILNNHNQQNIYWLRDEGHIATNNWMQILEDRCKKIINFSATNHETGGIVCNFTNTTMLRTVNQEEGTIEKAIKQLLDIKKQHIKVPAYNPCALFRVTTDTHTQIILDMARKSNLSVISLVNNDNYDMSDLCKDDNYYDIIISKQKITEGIDIRRAHVIWIENKPGNVSTLIQAIGRCRRNALLWREDIDIFAPDNRKLLQDTRQCYVFYNTVGTKVDTDENGELVKAFCPYITVQKLKPGHTVYVDDGQLLNGLYVYELLGRTGEFQVSVDAKTGFNIVNCDDFYSPKYATPYSTIMEWLNLVNSLSRRPTIYWKTLKNTTNNFITKGLFESQKWDISNKKELIYSRYRDIVQNDGRPYVEEQRVALSDILWNPQYFDFKFNIAKAKENHDIYMQYISPIYIKICIDEEIVQLTRKETAALIRMKHLSFSDVDFETRSTFGIGTDTLNTQSTVPIADKELAIIAINEFHQSKNSNQWVLNTSISSNIARGTKLSLYLEKLYEEEISNVREKLFHNVNAFSFPKKMNSCLGYCVEYYAKYLLFGQEYLKEFWTATLKERKDVTSTEIIAIRACMLKYRAMMKSTYGESIVQLVPSLTIEKLIEENSKPFIETICRLGQRTYDFIKQQINFTEAKTINYVLSTPYLVGLVDIMDSSTIIDIKCTNSITEQMLRQVLAYAFVSQYRPDIDIKRVIVYDAVSGQSITINTTRNKTLMPAQSISPEILFNKNTLYA